MKIPMLMTRNNFCRPLLTYGMPACVLTLLVAFMGDGLMRAATLAGATIAYAIVRRRKAYPFGRIASSGGSTLLTTSPSEALLPRLEAYKHMLRGAFLGWLAILTLVVAFSTALSAAPPYYFVFERITKLSTVLMSLGSHLWPESNMPLTQYVTILLRALDTSLLLSVSLFFSITGSACLYWLFLYYKDAEREYSPE